MQKQIFYIYKFKSSRLREFNYDISLTFEEAQMNKEVVSVFDSQLLRSIRKVNGKMFDSEHLSNLKKTKAKLKQNQSSEESDYDLKNIENEINSLLFVPEIITVVVENKSHYKYLFNNKLKLNGKHYRRFSCSAGQARVSNVLFCEVSVADKLDEILDNGRNKNKKLVPSKFNAYKGLVSSSTSVVSTPRFCLVPDYYSETEVDVNFVTETSLNEDDIIDIRLINEKFNRFDGQGLISVEMAEKWAEELGLDYVPSQWCVRQNYLKGMLTVFDIKRFCEKKNNGNYIIETSYLNSEGKKKTVDLRGVDVIVSESMFKLWNSFDSIEEYQENCLKNGLDWGVSLVSPKKDKDILKMNYQFIQTLNLDKPSIERLCEKFVDWISGVTNKDAYYSILFLLGSNISEDKIVKYLKSEDNHWVKALMIDNDLFSEKWVRKKIYDLMKKKIKNGCLGQILVDGNFQVLVSDPYAQMQHVCGQEVTGLLGKREYYSNYWNERNIKVVDSMRAPLTYRSEHLLLNLKNNDSLNEWYKYNTTGIIVNVHGSETMNWAGSDFDMDIIATTSDENIIKGVYQNELPIVYEPPKSVPLELTEKELYGADLHSFGSEIGQITNKSTSGYALLSNLNEGTEEYNTTINRIRMCTKLQSAQIDKAKIGRKVKSIPKIWVEYNKTNGDDSDVVKNNKKFLNSILLNKHPYFFTYLYKNTRKKYRKYYNNQDVTCKQKFGISIDRLITQKRKTKEQLEFLKVFDLYSPVINSDCVMNRLCKHIESVDFGIRNIIRNSEQSAYNYNNMMSGNFELDADKYEMITKKYKEFKEISKSIASASYNDNSVRSEYDSEIIGNVNIGYALLENELSKVCSNTNELVNYLIQMFYIDELESNKEVLWNIYGKYIVNNLLANKGNLIMIPFPDEKGNIEYLNKRYKLKEVILENE